MVSKKTRVKIENNKDNFPPTHLQKLDAYKNAEFNKIKYINANDITWTLKELITKWEIMQNCKLSMNDVYN